MRLLATARKCFVIGAAVFLFGLSLRIRMIFYARNLLQQVEAVMMSRAVGTDTLIGEGLMQIKIGTIVSYLLMAASTGILLLGVARNRQAAASPPPPAN